MVQKQGRPGYEEGRSDPRNGGGYTEAPRADTTREIGLARCTKPSCRVRHTTRIRVARRSNRLRARVPRQRVVVRTGRWVGRPWYWLFARPQFRTLILLNQVARAWRVSYASFKSGFGPTP